MMRESWHVQLKTGMLLLFPSALMHMVEQILQIKQDTVYLSTLMLT